MPETENLYAIRTRKMVAISVSRVPFSFTGIPKTPPLMSSSMPGMMKMLLL